jgi:hypothetical protein
MILKNNTSSFFVSELSLPGQIQGRICNTETYSISLEIRIVQAHTSIILNSFSIFWTLGVGSNIVFFVSDFSQLIKRFKEEINNGIPF